MTASVAPRPATPAPPVSPEPAAGWTAVCPLARIPREGGVAALVAGEAVAVFRTYDDRVFALSNLDPVSGASVMSRGIVGTRAGVDFVASPMHKQPWGLADGVCLDDPARRLPCYDVAVVDGQVHVGARRE